MDQDSSSCSFKTFQALFCHTLKNIIYTTFNPGNCSIIVQSSPIGLNYPLLYNCSFSSSGASCGKIPFFRKKTFLFLNFSVPFLAKLPPWEENHLYWKNSLLLTSLERKPHSNKKFPIQEEKHLHYQCPFQKNFSMRRKLSQCPFQFDGNKFLTLSDIKCLQFSNILTNSQKTTNPHLK